MGRPPIGREAMSNAERQRRFIEKLKARTVTNKTPAKDHSPADDIDVDAIAAWWQDASDQERKWLVEEIGLDGADGLAAAIADTDALRDYFLDEAVQTLEEAADEHGYWKIPDGVTPYEFDRWLESKGYTDWLHSMDIVSDDINAALDETDQRILAERTAAYDALEGPRTGDWCLLSDGKLRRFCYEGDAILWNEGRYELRDEGIVRFSGMHDRFADWPEFAYLKRGQDVIAKPKFKLQAETRPGQFWFCHHGQDAKGNAVNVTIRCRVYKLLMPSGKAKRGAA
jgi:hypothetical protein